MINSERLRRIVTFAGGTIAPCLVLFGAGGALKNTKRPYLRAVVALVAAIFAIAVSALVATGPASAASKPASVTGFAAHATAYQNAVLGDAMAAHPGGVRISASEVKWPNGTIAGAATSPTAAAPLTTLCADEHFCGYTGANYTGNYAWVGAEYGWWPFGQCSPIRYAGCDSGIRSWVNISGYRTWLEQYQGSGNELCISTDPAGNWEESDYNGVDTNDYWWLLSSNSAAC